VTTPSEPLIVLDLFETCCDPSDTPLVGALSVSEPALLLARLEARDREREHQRDIDREDGEGRDQER
jgi:hypothetical protein